jgi:hypothetical protein
MRKLYKLLLRFYPREIRVTFATEMLAVFDQAAEERRGQGTAAYARFAAGELAGLLLQAVTTRISRRRPDPAVDLGAMRPPDVSRETYAAAIDELLEAKQRFAFTLARMQKAISQNDFRQARYYAEEDRQAREHLRLVQQKYGISG